MVMTRSGVQFSPAAPPASAASSGRSDLLTTGFGARLARSFLKPAPRSQHVLLHRAADPAHLSPSAGTQASVSRSGAQSSACPCDPASRRPAVAARPQLPATLRTFALRAYGVTSFESPARSRALLKLVRIEFTGNPSYSITYPCMEFSIASVSVGLRPSLIGTTGFRLFVCARCQGGRKSIVPVHKSTCSTVRSRMLHGRCRVWIASSTNSRRCGSSHSPSSRAYSSRVRNRSREGGAVTEATGGTVSSNPRFQCDLPPRT